MVSHEYYVARTRTLATHTNCTLTKLENTAPDPKPLASSFENPFSFPSFGVR